LILIHLLVALVVQEEVALAQAHQRSMELLAQQTLVAVVVEALVLQALVMRVAQAALELSSFVTLVLSVAQAEPLHRQADTQSTLLHHQALTSHKEQTWL
jgi:hypothetical protein